MINARLTIFFVLLWIATLHAAQKIRVDALTHEDGALKLSYHIENLLDEKSLGLLQRGVTSQVVHHIQLWKQKGFINPLVKEHFYTLRIFYDNWEKKYRIITQDENRLTPQLESVKEKCSVMTDFHVVDMAGLETNQDYYLSISVSFQPVSAESYNAISEILKDDGKKSAPVAKKGGGYLSVLVNLLGLGDKEYSLKTPEFRVLDSGQVQLTQ